LLVETCLLKIEKLLLDETGDAKTRRISLSSDTIQRRILDMPDDEKGQVINEMKASPTQMFSFPVDLSTDVTSCDQMLAFVRYILPGTLTKSSCFVKNCKLQQVQMFRIK